MPSSAPKGLKVPAKGGPAALNHSRATSGKAILSGPRAEGVVGDLQTHVGTPKAAARRWGDLVVRKHRRRDPTSAAPCAVHSGATPTAPSEPQRRRSTLRGFFSRILGGSRSREHGANAPVSGESVDDTGSSTTPNSAATPPIVAEPPPSPAAAAAPPPPPIVDLIDVLTEELRSRAPVGAVTSPGWPGLVPAPLFSARGRAPRTPSPARLVPRPLFYHRDQAPRTPSPPPRRPLTVTRRDENTPSPDPTRAIWRQIRRVTQPPRRQEAAEPNVLNSAEKRMQSTALLNKRSLGAMTVRNLSLNDAWHEEERRVSGEQCNVENSPSPNPTRGIWMQIRRVTQPSRRPEAETNILNSAEKRMQKTARMNKRSLGAMTVRSEYQNDAWYEEERRVLSERFNV